MRAQLEGGVRWTTAPAAVILHGSGYSWRLWEGPPPTEGFYVTVVPALQLFSGRAHAWLDDNSGVCSMPVLS